MTLKDPLTEWASLLFSALARAGLRDVVASPGSRSTPFVLAAARTDGLRLWDLVDERDAAFFALGQAKATGRPALALCTSGSAGAHYLPAIVEARSSHTPLIVLTADRPLELQGCAAPQTIDQVKLFGDQVLGFFELGLPEASAGSVRALERLAAQILLTSHWPTPGPVHVNARARKPLEPHAPTTEADRASSEALAASKRGPPVAYAPKSMPSAEGLRELLDALRRAEAPLFLAGPGPLSQRSAAPGVAEWVRRANGVLLADAASQLRFSIPDSIAGFEAYLALPAFAKRVTPDLVIQLGAAPTSALLPRFLAAHPRTPRWVIAEHGWQDPESAASRLLFGDLGEVARAMGDGLRDRPAASAAGPTGWQRAWSSAERLAQLACAVYADGDLHSSLREGTVVREVVRSLRAGSRLFIGNSLPVRELDLFCPAELGGCEVLSQRGASGIDGLLAGAAGAASTGTAVTLVLGDVSFLHDLGGLAAAAVAGSKLTIVVLQNGGGRIFEDLPLAEAGVAEQMAHFTTPHRANLAAAAAIHGLPHFRVETRAELQAAIGHTKTQTTCTLIECAVPARGLRTVREELGRQVERGLS